MNEQLDTKPLTVGKYLLFCLQKEEFGIEILKVREIISAPKVVPLPKTPQHYKGVMNLRGQMIPVVDLRSLLGLPEKEVDRLTCTIVVEARVGEGELPMPDNSPEFWNGQEPKKLDTDSSSTSSEKTKSRSSRAKAQELKVEEEKTLDASSIMRIGITVDSVSEVVQVESKDVEKLRSISGQHWSNYLLGVAKKADRIISLINLDEVLKQ